MKDKLIQFMMGRYGTDTLNKHILYTVLVPGFRMIFQKMVLNEKKCY